VTASRLDEAGTPPDRFFEIDTPMKIAQPAVDCLILKATRSTPVTIRSAD
jgi:hypothetical protein